MQTHGGANAEKAILSRERKFTAKIEVDWNNRSTPAYDHALSNMSTFVSTVTVDRQLKGSAPEALMLIEGSSAAELEFEVGGEFNGVNMVSIFSPYNGASPFYRKNILGAEVKYSLGVETAIGTVWYPQFVGNIRTIGPSRAANNVVITALDRVEKLRRPVVLPKFAMSDDFVNANKNLAMRVRSHWIIDNCLRFGDTSVTPYRPNYREETNLTNQAEGPQFFFSGAGSILPSNGWIDYNEHSSISPRQNPPTNDKAAFRRGGMKHPNAPTEAPLPWEHTPYGQYNDESTNTYWFSCADRLMIRTGNMHYMCLTIDTQDMAAVLSQIPPTGDDGHGFYQMGVHVGHGLKAEIWIHPHMGGSVSFRVWSHRAPVGWFLQTEKIQIPTGQRHVPVRVIWDNNRQGTEGDRVGLVVGTNSNTADNTLKKYNTAAYPSDTGVDPQMGYVHVRQHIPCTDMGYASRNFVSTNIIKEFHEVIRPAKYAAVLDDGLVEFNHLPYRDGTDAWDILSEVAANEFGSVFWDENGIFRFWNYKTVQEKAKTPVRTLTTNEASELRITNSLDSVRNFWSIQKSRSRAVYAEYENTDSLKDYLYLGVMTTRKKIPLWHPDLMVIPMLSYEGGGYIKQLSSADWPYIGGSKFVAEYLINGTWQERVPGQGPGIMDIYMSWDFQGRPWLNIWHGWAEEARIKMIQLNGWVIKDLGNTYEQVRDAASSRRYGNRNYQIDGDWVQDTYTDNPEMVDTLKARMVEPIPSTDGITIAGDPRLQLGDAITLLDPDGIGEEMVLQIYGIRRRYSLDEGLVDDLTVEMTSPAGVGKWDSSQYGRWDTTFTWS